MVSKVGGPPGGMPPGAGGPGSAEEDSAIYSQLKKFINVIVSAQSFKNGNCDGTLQNKCFVEKGFGLKRECFFTIRIDLLSAISEFSLCA